jgi:adenine-specific DNA glycosylase
VDGLAAVELWQECFLSLLQAPKMVQENVIRHQFTHFSLDISLAIIEMEQLPQGIFDNDNYAWVDIGALSSHGMPTPVRKLLASLE